MKTTNTCILINTEQDLENILKTKDNIFILFYASWCPFSQRFLPVFEKCAQDITKQCYRMIIDELPKLCEKYLIEVYPTVLFFKKERPTKRLDGIHGEGLSEQQFRELIHTCERP
ncbi:MAG: protein disulfide isomerase family protein [Euryarchaeota archaeon]|jgi:thiol-disulfide isomerase/thioredoxin|nr:protein disulfide isomerase family protein [Euryarchaeota archaeon]